MKLKNLLEGGNVKFEVDGQSISGGCIHLHDVSDTLRYVSEITNIPYRKLWDGLLGSAGKETTSGDIDVVVDIENYSLEEFYDYMSTTYDFVERLPGFQTVCLLVPVHGHASKKIAGFNGYVQVDFFFGNKDWLKFSYHSAGRKSKYKGLWRTLLLVAVVAARTKFTDYDEEGDLIAKVGEIFDLNKGIITQYRMKTHHKKESSYVKTMKAVGVDDPEWIDRYGRQEYDEINITSPKEAAEFLFGPGTKPSKLDTFEKVKKLVSTLPKEEQFLVRKLFQIRSGYLLDEVPTKEEMLNEKVEKVRHAGRTIPVIVNPSKNAFLDFINKTDYKEVRGLMDEDDNFYFWDSGELVHWPMAKKLGINPRTVDYDPRLVISQSHKDEFTVSYEDTLEYKLINSKYFNDVIFKFNSNKLTERIEKVQVKRFDSEMVVPVYINPPKAQLRNAFSKSKSMITDTPMMRALYDNSNFYFWDATKTTHNAMAGLLGIDHKHRFFLEHLPQSEFNEPVLYDPYDLMIEEVYTHPYIISVFNVSSNKKHLGLKI